MPLTIAQKIDLAFYEAWEGQVEVLYENCT